MMQGERFIELPEISPALGDVRHVCLAEMTDALMLRTRVSRGIDVSGSGFMALPGRHTGLSAAFFFFFFT